MTSCVKYYQVRHARLPWVPGGAYQYGPSLADGLSPGLSLAAYRRETGVIACSTGPGQLLFWYQNCGVSSYWVRFSIACGSVAEMLLFQA